MPARAHRVEVIESMTGSSAPPHFASAFEVAVPRAGDRSAEQWARLVFEEARPLLRWFVVIGWKCVLRLRLASGATADQVLGWSVVSNQSDAITLEADSTLMTARKVVRVQDSLVLVTTFVHYKRPIAQGLWTIVVPIHHRTEPLLLSHAASA
jgi:hypothetical protein